MLAHGKLPLIFWWEAFKTSTYLINRLPTPLLSNKTPFELIYNSKPVFTHLKPFGCSCFPYLRPYNNINSVFIPQNAFLLIIARIIRGTSIYIHPVEFTFLEMSFLMRRNFLSPFSFLQNMILQIHLHKLVFLFK
ncbi:hypothetical protein ACOSQ2_022183 [Xanthoceras sorbifolium]